MSPAAALHALFNHCEAPSPLVDYATMGITITIPDDIASVLGSAPEEREQRARETIALELYREGRITLRAMGRLAGVGEDYWAADAFRIRHGLPAQSSAGGDGCSDELAVKALIQ